MLYPSELQALLVYLVGVERFELPTFCSQSRRATRLRYTPVYFLAEEPPTIYFSYCSGTYPSGQIPFSFFPFAPSARRPNLSAHALEPRSSRLAESMVNQIFTNESAPPEGYTNGIGLVAHAAIDGTGWPQSLAKIAAVRGDTLHHLCFRIHDCKLLNCPRNGRCCFSLLVKWGIYSASWFLSHINQAIGRRFDALLSGG